MKNAHYFFPEGSRIYRYYNIITVVLAILVLLFVQACEIKKTNSPTESKTQTESKTRSQKTSSDSSERLAIHRLLKQTFAAHNKAGSDVKKQWRRGIITTELQAEARFACLGYEYKQNIQVYECPDDFAEAYIDHRNAWQKKCRFFKRLDNKILLAGWDAMLGRGDSSVKRLFQEHENLNEEINTTWQKIEKLAVRYDIPMPSYDF